MPPGSFVQMGKKSAYVCTDTFLHWLKEHFFTSKRKWQGTAYSRWP